MGSAEEAGSESGTETASETTETGQGSADLTAEVSKWKALARKHETRAKENADAAEKLRQYEEEAQSEHERLVKIAVSEAEGRTRAELMRERVLDKIEVAVAGMSPVDLEAVVLKLAKDTDVYLSDGGIDNAAIKKAAEQLKTDSPGLFSAAGQQQRRPSHDQGQQRGGTPHMTGREQGLAEAQRRFGDRVKTT